MIVFRCVLPASNKARDDDVMMMSRSFQKLLQVITSTLTSTSSSLNCDEIEKLTCSAWRETRKGN